MLTEANTPAAPSSAIAILTRTGHVIGVLRLGSVRVNQAAEAVRDYPILDCGGVLEDHRDPRAVMATRVIKTWPATHTEDAQRWRPRGRETDGS